MLLVSGPQVMYVLLDVMRAAAKHRSEGKSRSPVHPPLGTIHRSIQLLRTALDELKAQMPLSEVELTAILINQAMTVEARSFHTPEHVFDLVDPGNPYMTLAALFHDLVYYQVDHGFVHQIADALRSDIEPWDGGLRLRQGHEAGDRLLSLCMAVFDVTPGQKLAPFGGMNEFLSALVMARKLGAVVEEKDLLLATACIEATIPFRPRDSSGRTPAERLYERLNVTNRTLDLALDGGTIEQAVRWAVTFANRDVANFADRDVTRFLDNTWKLLPETNPSLRTQGVYSIRSYRVALQKMEGFLRSLDPATIFAQYLGAPADSEYREMQQRGERNVSTAREYLGIKLLTAAILEALAEISGRGCARLSLHGRHRGKTEGKPAGRLPSGHSPRPHQCRRDPPRSARSREGERFELRPAELAAVPFHLSPSRDRRFSGPARSRPTDVR